MSRAYYNEFDPFAAQWLSNLISAGHIAPGDVDERSIVEVKADDLAGYNQCHFFAGIGGWSLALRLAGWPDDRPVWTGSCPCQPFSIAGRRAGEKDARHLWPEMFRLIRERDPATVFGEQVASADGCGWLTGVFTDLESVGYRVAGADLCAAGVGAPHIRQRLFWVADSTEAGASVRSEAGFAADRDEVAPRPGPKRQRGGWWGEAYWDMPDARRRCEPGSLPLVDGVSERVDAIGGYGNAIVPQVAAAFIRAALG